MKAPRDGGALVVPAGNELKFSEEPSDYDCTDSTVCKEGDQLWLRGCKDRMGATFRAIDIGDGIMLKAHNKGTCITRVRRDFLILQKCDKNEVTQKWRPISENSPFELISMYESNNDHGVKYCVTQVCADSTVYRLIELEPLLCESKVLLYAEDEAPSTATPPTSWPPSSPEPAANRVARYRARHSARGCRFCACQELAEKCCSRSAGCSVSTISWKWCCRLRQRCGRAQVQFSPAEWNVTGRRGDRFTSSVKMSGLE